MTRQLPYNVPYFVKVSLIRTCFEDWKAHVENCFEAVRTEFETYIFVLVDQHFKRFIYGGLYDFVR